MPNVLQVFPEAEGEEQLLISGLIADMTDQQAQIFAVAYRAQRKDPTTTLILTLIGFIVLAGIGRFYVGNIGMGILYLLTGGLCWIGTIIDVVKHKQITFQVNLVKAQQIAIMAKAQSNT
jgi:TM2 domain-containing membrane protein YozV